MDKKQKRDIKDILSVSPVIVIYLAQILKNEYIIFASSILTILLIFLIKYEKREVIIFCIGIILGIIIEIGGNLIYHLQYWSHGAFYGIPLWLPVFWGIAMVVFRRIGNFIINL